jgi:hypothetical protein
MLRVTVPGLPITAVEIALVPLVPWARLRLPGDALMVKSVPVMVRATDVECELGPSVPVTVIV